MKNLVFTWTKLPLLAGAKTVTRRDWKPTYAADLRTGDYVLAVDKGNRAHGRPIALLQLMRDPYYENLRDMPDADFEAEGLAWLAEHAQDDHAVVMSLGLPISREHLWQWFVEWRESGWRVCVLRFALVLRLDHLDPARARHEAHHYAGSGSRRTKSA